jgi:hypothetical protein
MAEFRAWYIGLDAAAQSRALATIGTHLTISARAAYVPGSEEIAHPIILRRANEIQHRIFGQLGKLLEDDARRYSEEGFADMLIESFNSVPLDMSPLLRDLGIGQ